MIAACERTSLSGSNLATSSKLLASDYFYRNWLRAFLAQLLTSRSHAEGSNPLRDPTGGRPSAIPNLHTCARQVRIPLPDSNQLPRKSDIPTGFALKKSERSQLNGAASGQYLDVEDLTQP